MLPNDDGELLKEIGEGCVARDSELLAHSLACQPLHLAVSVVEDGGAKLVPQLMLMSNVTHHDPDKNPEEGFEIVVDAVRNTGVVDATDSHEVNRSL